MPRPSPSRLAPTAQPMTSSHFPPTKIFAVRSESGLFLQVKKAFVRKAYEQGRLLDPQDLTDDAVFSLIREDENVRVLVTREIEDRSYVRAKPTREELARGLVSEPLRGQPNKAAPSGEQTKPAPTQEEAYWAEHEGREEQYPERYQYPQNLQQTPGSQPSYNVPLQPREQNPLTPNPEQPLPQEPGVGDRRRQLERAQAPLQQGDYPDSLQAGSSAMPSITPDDLPQLLSTSNSQQSMSSAGRGMGRSGAGASIPDDRSLMPSGPWPDQLPTAATNTPSKLATRRYPSG